MNIVFFMHHSLSNRDGASLSLKNVTEELSERGHNVYVIYPTKSQYLNPLSDTVNNLYVRAYSMRIKTSSHFIDKIKYFIKSIFNLFSIHKAYKILKNSNIDVIHINGIDNEVGAKVAKKVECPYVWHIRAFLEEDLEVTLFNKKLMYNLLRDASELIGISNSICEKYANLLNKEVRLIYNGVPIEDYAVEDDHAFKNECIKMQIAGRITEKKGQMDAVKAVEILKKRGHNLRLQLFGYGVDNYYDNLLSYLEDNGLQENVSIVEYTNDLRSFRKNTDIGLVTSVNEAFGRVTIENFLSKMICIGANTGGTKELIGENFGFLYEQGNPDSLANIIEYVINPENSSEVLKKVKSAYEFSISNFSIERVVDELLNVYRNIIYSKGQK